jgi:uncharacterized protein YceK
MLSALLLFCIVALLSGCGSLSPEPFAECSQSMQKSSSAIDTVLGFNTHWAREDDLKQAFNRLSKHALESWQTET